ncbi:MAG: ATP-dependent helicase [Hespellia sp.]|nr:ATP-dependent helicase [Hespellia sp.]
MSLNKAQYEAVAHKDGPCLVLAGPGSGKTLTIVKRIEYMIEKCKVRPEDILVITFTKYAAKEMKSRFLYQQKKTSTPVTFGTFHGIYYGILKWAYGFKAENLLSEEEKYQLLKQIVGQQDLEIGDVKDFIQEICGEIGRVKNNQAAIETYEATVCEVSVFRDIFVEYEMRRKKARKIDFDDMLVLCHQLFVSRPDILKKWQERFPYIMVDEFQDINQVQYNVIKMLARPQNNLFVVGDDDQSIYAFRGAKPEIMMQFKQDFPDAKEILLNINYRSSKNIVNNALRVIGHNKTRFPKEIQAQNEPGANVHVQEVKDRMEENQYILSEIDQLLQNGVEAEQIAVLYRTNDDVRSLAETLMEYNIPFQMRDRFMNIYEHFIGENIRTYLHMVQGSRKRQEFLDVMNRPKRYLSRESMEKPEIAFEDLRRFYCDKDWMLDRIDQWELDLRVMKPMTPYAAINYLRKRVGYDSFLQEYAAFRHMNAEKLFEIINEIQEHAKPYATFEEWTAHIEEYTKALRIKERAREENREGIRLLTMHGAKGLEFKAVFVIEANEGITPYKKAELKEEIEEERRLFYVAMTRAKRSLKITYVKNKNGKDMVPSRFVNELLAV